jgi:hypothetical protein
LWSDATLCTFINEAQRKFAVRSPSSCVTGPRNEATLIPLVAGQTIYDLHESVHVGDERSDRRRVSGALNRVGHSRVHRLPHA